MSKKDRNRPPKPVRHEPAGFFVLRAPLLSIDTLGRWGTHTDPEQTRESLRRLVQRPEVREAIAVASPSLVEGLPGWLVDPHGEAGQ
ncbi:MAG: lantibiotic dehydratase family protein [Deltaproteobacteria bacterium]|nr:lantibiotic dehydratase family protein [Deltaproteobacteria bacterium]